MYKLNKAIVMGNLVSDPLCKEVTKNDGKASKVANFTLAINREYYVKSKGEKQEEVTFVRVTAWNREAEQAEKFLAKGSTVLVEGRLTNRPIHKEDGSIIDTVEITADEIFFIKLKDKDESEESEE